MFKDINELINWIGAQKRSLPKVSLDRMKEICSFFGNPQDKVQYIHVAGTNGKGSTISFTKYVLMEAGYNVGAFISPYVDVFNERISYNSSYISDEDLLEISNEIINKYYIFEERLMPTPSFFEFITLIAFIYFSRCKDLDVVVLEVGIGGLLDCTNIIIPLVSIITSISYDHTKILGDTIEEITMNKLGIVKPGIPLITLKDERVFNLVEKVTKALNSQLIFVGNEDIKNIEVSFKNTCFDYKNLKAIELGLLGYHQTENAALVIEVIQILIEKYNYNISEENLRAGFKKTFWPGRLQLISHTPPILIDGAHNPGGIIRLVEFLKSIKGDYRLRIVFAVSADKDKVEMIKILDDVADELIFTRFEYSRSSSATHLALLSSNPHVVEEDWHLLYHEAKSDKGAITVFCGSLYFVSEIYNYVKQGCFK